MFDHSIYKWFYVTAIAMILAVVVLFVQLSTDLAHSPQPVAVVVIVLIAAIFGFIITGCLSIQRLLDTHPKPGAHQIPTRRPNIHRRGVRSSRYQSTRDLPRPN